MNYTRRQLQQLCLKGVIKTSDYFLYSRILLSRKARKPNQRHRFDLDKLTEVDCRQLLRFSSHEIRRMMTALNIPQFCKTKITGRFTGIEGFCILLRRLVYPNRLYELQKMFFRDLTAISRIFSWMLQHVFKKVHQLMASLNHAWLTDKCLQEFAEVITAAGSRYPNIVGFIDGTARPICRPKYQQELQYSGYKKQHVLKYQSVMLPNGLIGRLDGPINGRRHDAAILRLSQLLEELETKFVNPDGTWYALYGDPGYSNQKFIKVGFKNVKTLTQEQKNFNSDMSSLRISVEYGFGKIVQYFSFLDYKKNQKLYLQPLKEMYIVAAVLTNCLSCLRGSQVSDFFNCSPPSLEEYLNCK